MPCPRVSSFVRSVHIISRLLTSASSPIVVPSYSDLQSPRTSNKGKQTRSLKLFPHSRYDPASRVLIETAQSDKDGSVYCHWDCFHTCRVFLKLTAASARPPSPEARRRSGVGGRPCQATQDKVILGTEYRPLPTRSFSGKPA